MQHTNTNDGWQGQQRSGWPCARGTDSRRGTRQEFRDRLPQVVTTSATAFALLLLFVSSASAQQAETPAAQAETPPAAETPAADAPNADAPAGDATGDAEGEPQPKPKRELPKLADMVLPTAEELLRGHAVDWIVLKDKDEHVMVVELVTPRPDTLAKMQAAIDEKLKQRKTLSGEALETWRHELIDMANIQVDLPDQIDETIYQLHMDKVSRIIHHEDLMLLRIDKLIEEQNFELGYELLNVLRRKTPDWPGAAQRHVQFLLAEADRRAKRGDLEPALATIEEIHERNASFAGVSEAAGRVIDQIISQAVEQQDWRRARHFIGRLDRMYDQHPVAVQWENDLSARAEQQLTQAEQAATQGDDARAAMLADSATRIWPQTRNLRTRHRVYADRYQRLHVGVLDLPESHAGDPVLASRADRREMQLQTLPFFQVDNAADGSAHYASRFCDRWEPLNLGREAVFDLRSNRQPWEMQPIVTAPSIAVRLARRLDPADELYDERLASYAHSIEVDSPFSFKVQFHRVPVRTEALLTIPVAEDLDFDVDVVSSESESDVSVDVKTVAEGFPLTEVTEQTAVYQRAMPEPDDLRLYHVAEIQEHRYADYNGVFQALLRGDVSLIPYLPPRYIDRLRSDESLLKGLFVEKMALPLTHVIQINPRSVPLKNSEFRRALMYAVDRQKILTETVLDGAPADMARLVSGPFPSASYANNALATQREYDTVSAISLLLAARKQLGGTLPPLKMVVIDEPIARAAAAKVVAGWKMFGIEVEIIPPPDRLVDPADGDAAPWDLLYRTVQMVEPVVDLWPFLTLTGRARVADLDPFPDWLRQEIINLDLAGDWSTAVQETKRLHLHLWSEVMLIPLWEVDQYLVYRKHLRGVPVSPVKVYDAVDGWVVEAWYPEDEP